MHSFSVQLKIIELILILSFHLTFSVKHSGLNYRIAFLNLVTFKDMLEWWRIELEGAGDEGHIMEYAGIVPSPLSPDPPQMQMQRTVLD